MKQVRQQVQAAGVMHVEMGSKWRVSSRVGLDAAIRKAFSDAPHCRPAYQPDMDMHLMLRFFNASVRGPSGGAAFVLGVVQYMTGCKLIPRVRPTLRLLQALPGTWLLPG
jgi:hypothetical protein